MSVPFGAGGAGDNSDGESLPVGVQVLAPALGEEAMFQVGAFLESVAPLATAGKAKASPAKAGKAKASPAES